MTGIDNIVSLFFMILLIIVLSGVPSAADYMEASGGSIIEIHLTLDTTKCTDKWQGYYGDIHYGEYNNLILSSEKGNVTSIRINSSDEIIWQCPTIDRIT